MAISPGEMGGAMVPSGCGQETGCREAFHSNFILSKQLDMEANRPKGPVQEENAGPSILRPFLDRCMSGICPAGQPLGTFGPPSDPHTARSATRCGGRRDSLATDLGDATLGVSPQRLDRLPPRFQPLIGLPQSSCDPPDQRLIALSQDPSQPFGDGRWMDQSAGQLA